MYRVYRSSGDAAGAWREGRGYGFTTFTM